MFIQLFYCMHFAISYFHSLYIFLKASLILRFLIKPIESVSLIHVNFLKAIKIILEKEKTIVSKKKKKKNTPVNRTDDG